MSYEWALNLQRMIVGFDSLKNIDEEGRAMLG